MSRIALGAMHSAKLHSPAHTWFVIFIYTEEDCVEEYMHAELYTTGDKERSLHVLNLISVSSCVQAKYYCQ